MARGWCSKHYARWRLHGDPFYERVIVGDLPRRFWSKVDKDGPTPRGRPDLGPCWLFTGCLRDPERKGGGYGQFEVSAGKSRAAHRVAYELEVGPIPEGKNLDHLCHNDDRECVGGGHCQHRACVRPSHLEPVSHSQNIGRIKDRREFCPHGHRYDEAGYERRNEFGYRLCSVCYPLARAIREPGKCPQGHLLEGDNAKLRSDGYLMCRTCRSETQRKYNKKYNERQRQMRGAK